MYGVSGYTMTSRFHLQCTAAYLPSHKRQTQLDSIKPMPAADVLWARYILVTVSNLFRTHTLYRVELQNCAMADEIDDLLNRLSGKELHVPDLLTILGDWKTNINSHLGQLRPLVRPMLEAYV